MRTAAAVFVFLLAAACGSPATTSADDSEEPAATATAEPSAAPSAAPSDDEAAAGASVAVANTSLGEVLVDGEGRVLYLLTGDKQGESTCYDDCATNWPPLEGPAEAGDGADASLLGDTEREDGTVQVTYNKWPVYYFAGDSNPGDTNGQGVGDVWFVLDASGNAIKSGGGDEGAIDY